jgi:hypothetical protein
VNVDHTADWWLGDLTHPWFLELERAIHDEWGREPMRVREGGVRPHFFPSHTHTHFLNAIPTHFTQQSIPCVPFLEKAFRCPALHLPMGQSEVRDEFFFFWLYKISAGFGLFGGTHPHRTLTHLVTKETVLADF